jgi:hypothetical protein
MNTMQPRRIACARSCLLLLGLVATLSLAQASRADTASTDAPVTESSFSLNGFGTLGMARSSSDQAEFVRDLSQPHGITNDWSSRIDSVLGVQANWQITPEHELVGQAVTRYHYDGSHDPELMWAFAKWDPDARVSLRAGRIGADFMMAADSRLVGYSYLPVRPSADFFGPLFFSHFDGVDASLTLPLGAGLVRGKLFTGATQEKTSGTPGIWDTSGSPVAGAVFDYLSGAWQFRASATKIQFSNEIKFAPLPALLQTAGAIAAANALTTKDTSSHFYSLGVVYDEGPLQVQAMLNKIRHETGVFQNSHAGYLLAGYRFHDVTPYAGVSWWKSSYKPYTTGLSAPVFAALNAQFDYIMRASGADQTTYSLGGRWDVLDNAALKLQWDAIRGNATSRFPYGQSQPGWNGRTDVLSLTLDFVF